MCPVLHYCLVKRTLIVSNGPRGLFSCCCIVNLSKLSFESSLPHLSVPSMLLSACSSHTHLKSLRISKNESDVLNVLVKAVSSRLVPMATLSSWQSEPHNFKPKTNQWQYKNKWEGRRTIYRLMV